MVILMLLPIIQRDNVVQPTDWEHVDYFNHGSILPNYITWALQDLNIHGEWVIFIRDLTGLFAMIFGFINF